MSGRDTHNITASRSTEWLFEVSRGKVPGHKAIAIESLVPSVDIADGTVDVWTGGGDLDYLDVAETMGVVSSDIADTNPLSVGASLMVVRGVGDDYKDVTEIVSMNGTNAVTTQKKFLRVLSLTALDAGSAGANVGDITATSSVSGKLQCHCLAAAKRSANSQYTVPAGQSFIPVGLQLNGSRTLPAVLMPCMVVDGDSRVQIPGTDFSLTRQFQFRVDTGMGHFPFIEFPVINPVIEKSDVRLRISTDTDGTELRALFFGVQYASDIA